MDQLHSSIVDMILSNLDVRSKCSFMSTCSGWYQLCLRPEVWRVIEFDTEQEHKGLQASDLSTLVGRAKGTVETLILSGSEAAREVHAVERFNNGITLVRVWPYTRGLRAYSLAAALPCLRKLHLDERTSCIGGITNDFARAIAIHCPKLMDLEIRFAKYSIPAELFTDVGLTLLAEGCTQLRSLSLKNCDGISDRSLYALAAYCPSLQTLSFGGYSEHLTDGGFTVLFEVCDQISTVLLSSKLLKVTNESVFSLAQHCPQLQRVKLTASMTDSTLEYLAKHNARLEQVDLKRSRRMTSPAVWNLLQACPSIHRLCVPIRLGLLELLLFKGVQVKVVNHPGKEWHELLLNRRQQAVPA